MWAAIIITTPTESLLSMEAKVYFLSLKHVLIC